MVTMTVLATTAAVIKFLLDGVSIDVAGHVLSFGHVDSMAYGSLLTPVLAAHGFVDTRPSRSESVMVPKDGKAVDDPDEV